MIYPGVKLPGAVAGIRNADVISADQPIRVHRAGIEHQQERPPGGGRRRPNDKGRGERSKQSATELDLSFLSHNQIRIGQ